MDASSLKTAMESIPNWTKGSKGTTFIILFDNGNVVAGMFGIYDNTAGSSSSYTRGNADWRSKEEQR